MKKQIFYTVVVLMLCNSVIAQVRSHYTLEKGWKFTRQDDPAFTSPAFSDTKWQSVRIPHDWAIYGPFDPENDKQLDAIQQDGQTEAMYHIGRTGGLPFVGTGWYRIEFELPEQSKEGKTFVLFDGAMSNAEVYVNGEKVGNWPNGYNSFYFDISSVVQSSGKNLLAVRLENLPESSRWYPGAGLYRNVHIISTSDAYIPLWENQLTTPVITDSFAKVNLKTPIVYPEGKTGNNFTLKTDILSPGGELISSVTTQLGQYDQNCFNQELVIPTPSLWSPDNPFLYTAISRLYEGNVLKDEYKTTFGIRDIRIIPDEGFYLNGEKIQFKGVCLHHDLGPLGAAVNKAAIRRQLQIMKDMGCKAIRTSHNMPAPEVVKACDEMGLMIMVESFDEWNIGKCKNGYHLYFDEWVEKDLVNLVRHYRNNPSVVMWCIGNEVPNQWRGEDSKIARFLQDICHREDPTRPVTQGMDGVQAVIDNNFAATMEVPGFNYRPFLYQEAYRKLPQQVILGAETVSTLSSRGIYKFPVQRRSMAKYPDHQSSSYDVEHCGWSNLPEDDFIQHEDLPYCMGEFVWTGFDYLGEPTPYYSDWPSHSSMFGIVDLAGIPKDRYYLYQSHWNKEKETLHILPHWTWPGREGEITPVFVYTNYPAAELFINGKSQGIRKKDLSIQLEGSYTEEARNSFERQKRYRLMWMDTQYEPGTLKVVAYDVDGNPVTETEIHTAGKPDRIVLTPEKSQLSADGKDLAFVNVSVVDRDGNPCPDADNLVKLKVKGAGTYEAAANGNSASLELFHEPQMSLFSGQLTAIVRAGEQPGTIRFEASGKGLKSAVIELISK